MSDHPAVLAIQDRIEKLDHVEALIAANKPYEPALRRWRDQTFTVLLNLRLGDDLNELGGITRSLTRSCLAPAKRFLEDLRDHIEADPSIARGRLAPRAAPVLEIQTTPAKEPGPAPTVAPPAAVQPPALDLWVGSALFVGFIIGRWGGAVVELVVGLVMAFGAGPITRGQKALVAVIIAACVALGGIALSVLSNQIDREGWMATLTRSTRARLLLLVGILTAAIGVYAGL